MAIHMLRVTCQDEAHMAMRLSKIYFIVLICMTYVLSHFGSGVLHLHCGHSYGHQFHCGGNPQVGSPCQCKLDCQDKWDHCLGQRFQQYSEGLVHLEMEKWELTYYMVMCRFPVWVSYRIL